MKHVHDNRPVSADEQLHDAAQALIDGETPPGEDTCRDCVKTLAGRLQSAFEDFADESDFFE